MTPRARFQSDWLDVSGTFVPAPGTKSKLTVVDVSPVRFAVTYPTHATGLYWALSMAFMIVGFLPLAILSIGLGAKFPWLPVVPTFFGICAGIPMVSAWLVARPFRRPEGGRVCLEPGTLQFERGAVWRTRRDVPLAADSRFCMEDVGGDESTIWSLQLATHGKKTMIARHPDLEVADLRWLSHRLNEWLGWEFPSHCHACGRPLESTDVDWPQRRVNCSQCGYLGPAPDPFADDAVAAPPAAGCPSCLDPIWLMDVNRETGGCRCLRCGWSSPAAPPVPLEGLADVPNWLWNKFQEAIGNSFHRYGFLGDEQLIEAFATKNAAWSHLTDEKLVLDDDPRSRTVTYKFRRLARFSLVVAGLAVVAILLSRQLYFHFQVPLAQRHWFYYTGRLVLQFNLLLCILSLGGLIWWSWQTVRLTFTSYALQWTVAGRKRLIAWHTLSDVTVPKLIWPPTFCLTHGGAGLFLVTPTASSARALARLCLSHREEATKSGADDDPSP